MLIMSRDGTITRDGTSLLPARRGEPRRHALVRRLAALRAGSGDQRQQRLDTGAAPRLTVMVRNGTLVG